MNTKIRMEEIKAMGPMKLPTTSILDYNGKILKLQPIIVPPKVQINLYGIEDTLKAVDLIAAISNALFRVSLQGWRINWFTGITVAIPIMWKLIPALDGIGNVPNELDDLNDREKDALLNAVKAKLTFSDDAESIIGMSLDILYKFKLLTGLFK